VPPKAKADEAKGAADHSERGRFRGLIQGGRDTGFDGRSGGERGE